MKRKLIKTQEELDEVFPKERQEATFKTTSKCLNFVLKEVTSLESNLDAQEIHLVIKLLIMEFFNQICQSSPDKNYLNLFSNEMIDYFKSQTVKTLLTFTGEKNGR